MPQLRVVTGVVGVAMVLSLLAGCTSTDTKNPPFVSPASALPASTVLATVPADWRVDPSQFGSDVGTISALFTRPRGGAADYTALIINDAAAADTSAVAALAALLAQHRVSSLRFAAPAGAFDNYQAMTTATRAAFAELMHLPGVDKSRLVVVGLGTGAGLAVKAAAGEISGAPKVRGLAMIEPVDRPEWGADGKIATFAHRVDGSIRTLLTCSAADISAPCTTTQHVADVMSGAHVNFVQIPSMTHSLTNSDTPDTANAQYSGALSSAIADWVAMQ